MATKTIRCLVCERPMEVDEKKKYGMCWKCVEEGRFDEYREKKRMIKRKRRSKSVDTT